MKGKRLLMVAGGMLALGWSGTALASPVTGSVWLKSIQVVTNPNETAQVHFSNDVPTATAADSFAGLYYTNPALDYVVGDHLVANTGALGTLSESYAKVGATEYGKAIADDTAGGELTIYSTTMVPGNNPALQYAYTYSQADIWRNFTISGKGTVTFTAEYSADLTDDFYNPPTAFGGDTGNAWAGLALYKVTANGQTRIKYDDQGIQIDEWQSDHKDSATNGKLVVQIVLNKPSTLTYALNAYAGADATDPHPTPEPATMLLLGSGLAGLVGIRRKKA